MKNNSSYSQKTGQQPVTQTPPQKQGARTPARKPEKGTFRKPSQDSQGKH
jgi:hypothetical protein